VYSGGGNDRVYVQDGERDRISCGRGLDFVAADSADVVSRGCEDIHRAR